MKHLILSAMLISAGAAHADPSNDFQNACERAIKQHLTQPATFEPNYWRAPRPSVITFPADHAVSWFWSLPFKASNAYGTAGRFRATCSQAPSGKVVAIIGEDRP